MLTSNRRKNMSKNERFCRICLAFVNSEIPTELNGVNLQILKLVSPLTNLVEISPTSVMCENCSECLQKSFEFKTTCLSNEDYLNTFHSDNDIKIALNEILPKENPIKSEVKEENTLICRLCLNYCSSEQVTDLSRIEDDLFLKDMIDKGLSEINLNNTRDDNFMCDGCMHSLQNQFNLISTLLDTNDKIKDFISHNAISNNNNEIDLGKVLQFVQNIRPESKNEHDPIKVKEEIKLEVIVDEDQTVVLVKEEFLKEETEDWDNVTKDGIIDRKLLERNAEGLYECVYCPHTTTTRDNVWQHMRTHQNNLQLKCDKCEFATKWPSSLHQHSWLHNGGTIYYCDFCSYKSRYKKHVKRHSVRHEASLKHHCKDCDFSTKSRTYFIQHIKQKHGKDIKTDVAKSFSCEQCDYVADRKCLLTLHCRKEHKRLVCEYCGFQTSLLWHLKDHMLKHQDETEVTMYKCANCDFQTKYKNSLKNHLVRHCPEKREKGRRRRRKGLVRGKEEGLC